MATEKRLIDVNAVICEMQNCLDNNPDAKGSVTYHVWEGIIEILKREPTVDAVHDKRVHGEWADVIHAVVDTTGYCTRCGKKAVWRTRDKPYNICPYCGADMRGDGNG